MHCQFFLFFAGLLVHATFASTVSFLDKNNYTEVTAGKTVFVKFYAPWCPHCQELEPVWELMAAEWISHDNEHHSQGLVAQVDCTTPVNEPWCRKELQIVGLPTLLYGEPSFDGIFLEQYAGDRSYEALSRFANKTLVNPICSPGNLDACEPDLRQQVESYWKMTSVQVEEMIADKERAIEGAEETFKREFGRMQAIYNQQATDHELTTQRLKENIKLIQEVKLLKSKA